MVSEHRVPHKGLLMRSFGILNILLTRACPVIWEAMTPMWYHCNMSILMNRMQAHNSELAMTCFCLYVIWNLFSINNLTLSFTGSDQNLKTILSGNVRWGINVLSVMTWSRNIWSITTKNNIAVWYLENGICIAPNVKLSIEVNIDTGVTTTESVVTHA